MTNIQRSIFQGFLPFFVTVFLTLATGPATAQALRSGPVEARLVAQDTSVQPGRQFLVALSLSMDADWHV
jgi:hypothetical protein